jgi:hypothetical protein
LQVVQVVRRGTLEVVVQVVTELLLEHLVVVLALRQRLACLLLATTR